MVFKLTILFSLSVLFAFSNAVLLDIPVCSSRDFKQQLKAVTRFFRDEAKRDFRKAAKYIRAAFHDCATAQAEDPDSGCNGSLQFELPPVNPDGSADVNLPFANNLRLIDVTEEYKQVQATYPCLTVAEVILVSYEEASRAIKAGGLTGTLVSESKRTQDRTEADALVNGFLDLPSGGQANFGPQLQFYQRKGFDATDFVVSLVVGHSVGGFAPQGQPGPIFDFTVTSPERLNGDYCGAHLALRTRTNILPPSFAFPPLPNEAFFQPIPDFHFLPSDYSIAQDPQGVAILESFCGIDITSKQNYFLKFTETTSVIQAAWVTFSVKMGNLRGANL